jgi:hypothetical protein
MHDFIPSDFFLSDHHFERTEVIKAELQAMLKTLPEYDFQDTFKKWQKHWEQSIHAEGDYFKSDGGQ